MALDESQVLKESYAEIRKELPEVRELLNGLILQRSGMYLKANRCRNGGNKTRVTRG